MTKIATINNTETPAPAGAVAWKYADATEDARWIYDQAEADDIAREDPSLIERVKDAAAVSLGRRGGQSTSTTKAAAARANGARGGRPSLREQAEARVDGSAALSAHKDFIMADWPEGVEHWKWVLAASEAEIVDWAQAGE